MITKADVEKELKPRVSQDKLQRFLQQLSQADLDNITEQLQYGKWAAVRMMYVLYNEWENNV